MVVASLRGSRKVDAKTYIQASRHAQHRIVLHERFDSISVYLVIHLDKDIYSDNERLDDMRRSKSFVGIRGI